MPSLYQPDEVLRGVTAAVAALTERDAGSLNPGQRFAECGLDSMRMVTLVGRLADQFQVPLTATACWKHPSVGELAGYIYRVVSGSEAPARGPQPAEETVAGSHEAIAVVGLGCRFPAGLSVAAFWAALCAGVDAVDTVPARRAAGLADPTTDPLAGPRAPRRAGFLDVAVEDFDPIFFGISPREAAEMDPQQRLLMEVAWEALEDGGLANERLAGSRTGVFVGAVWHDFADLRARFWRGATPHTATGQASNMIANRLSYALGLTGPSMVVDSACSSSLLAVHLACQSLRTGESDIALAGGVNLILGPQTTTTLTAFGGLAADGRCKAFDASGDGFGRGEGCGVLVLRRLSDALAEGQRIWCVIPASAANNDGASNGLTAPSPDAQEDVLRQAYRRAGLTAEQVQYVECHGTGTALGDPIEAEALGAALGRDRDAAGPLLIGSVKSNIGHLEAAAGVAGLIKTILAVHHRVVPPNLHCLVPNPNIDFAGLGITVNTELREWPAVERRVAGVSAFGWGGTNVHVVVQGWDEPAPVNASSETADRGEPAEVGAAAKIAFVCSPHGHLWPGMGRLMFRQEPAFRASFTRISDEFRRHSGTDLSRLLFADESVADDVRVSQPLQFAVQVAIAEWLAAQGIRPDVTLGHSLGELSAAVIAGILPLPDAVRLLYHYTAQQARVAGPDQGMALFELSVAELAGWPAVESGTLAIAAENGPRSTALSGPLPELRAAVEAAKSAGVLAAVIPVDVAGHGPAIEPVVADLTAATQDLRPQPAAVPMISSLTGQPLPGEQATGEYFARNLRHRVRLTDALRTALELGFDLVLEISAHPVLLPALRQTIDQVGNGALALPTMRRDADDRIGLFELRDRLAGNRREVGTEPQLCTIAGRSPASLRALAAGVAEAVPACQQAGYELPDIVQSLAARADGGHRLAVLATDPADLRERLQRFLAGNESPDLWHAAGSASRTGRAVFLFPGQGSQWLGMGRQLLASEEVFAASLRRCDQAARGLLDWSLIDTLAGSAGHPPLADIDVIQPLLFAIEVALAELWMSWGVQPAAVVGHSMGEAAAAYIAGALELSDALRILCLRSRLMKRMSGRGAMLSIELGADELAGAVAPYADRVSIAVCNSHRSTVLAGDAAALEVIRAELAAAGEFCRWVKVDVASHSPQMDGLLPELRQILAGLQPRTGRLPIYSTVTGEIADGSELDVEYWCDNLRKPVLFGRQIERLVEAGTTAFIEMSPHPLLLQSVESIGAAAGVPVTAVPSLRRDQDERASMLGSLGRLFVGGVAFDRAATCPPGRPGVPLPNYPWDRQRYWPAELTGPGRPEPVTGGLSLPPRLDPAGQPGAHYWQLRIAGQTASMHEHQVAGSTLVPGAVLLNLLVAAAAEVLGPDDVELFDVRFLAPLIIRDDHDGVLVQLMALASGDETIILRAYQVDDSGLRCVAEAGGRSAGAAEQPLADEGPAEQSVAEQSVAEHGQAEEGPAEPGQAEQAETEPAPLGERLDPAVFYAELADQGLRLGPAYQGIRSIERGAGQVRCEIEVPAGRSGDTGSRINPALLDAALQSALLAAERPAELPAGATLLSSEISRFRLLAPVPVRAVAVATGRPGEPAADVRVMGTAGQLVAEAIGVRMAPAELDRIVRAASGDSALDQPPGQPSGQPATTEPLSRAVLAALDSETARQDAMRAAVQDELGQVLRIEPRMIGLHQPLRELGIDSAMSLELRNRLELRYQLQLPASLVFNYPTLGALAGYLLERLALPPVAGADRLMPAVSLVDPGVRAVPVSLDRELDELASWIEQI